MGYLRISPMPVDEGGTGATTLTDHGVLLGSGTAAITPLAAMTNGQLVIGSTGADPVVASLTAGTAVSISTGAGSITINASGGGMSVVEVTGTSDTGDPDTAYIANNAGLVTITLNGTFPLGSVIEVSGKGTGLWQIAQGAGQTCHVGLLNTTTGAGGSIAATAQYDSITLRCITANTDFVATGGFGNWTIV